MIRALMSMVIALVIAGVIAVVTRVVIRVAPHLNASAAGGGVVCPGCGCTSRRSCSRRHVVLDRPHRGLSRSGCGRRPEACIGGGGGGLTGGFDHVLGRSGEEELPRVLGACIIPRTKAHAAEQQGK